MNSVANGKVYLRTPFKKMYLPAAAGDAGGAIGAAAVVAAKFEHKRAGAVWVDGGSAIGSGAETGQLEHQSRKAKVEIQASSSLPRGENESEGASSFSTFSFLPSPLKTAYLGPQFSNAEIAELLKSRKTEIEAANCTISEITNNEELCTRAAQSIADGRVLGWFQGRMEWGPRALGNRSILGDPRRADMKEILNAKIKRRESFRPFAPSILREEVSNWFEQDDDVPFMMQVFQIKEEKRSSYTSSNSR